MLIATITALIVLFSGGYEIFFAENVEKGIKKYVLEKDRRKELLDMTKEIKKGAKTYTKDRKASYKDFKDLYTNFNTTEEELEVFFKNLTDLQMKYQDNFVDKRVQITERITDAEWANIVTISEEAYQKKLNKLEKKKQKDKDAFSKTRKSISEIADQKSQDAVTAQLNSFSENVAAFESSMKNVNVLENDLLVKKSNSKEELLTLYQEMNEIRQKGFKNLIDFHSAVKSSLEQEQGEEILSAFYKDISLAPM